MIYIAQTVFSPNDLQHFGVKGMRWGVRRQQIKLAKKEVKRIRKDANFRIAEAKQRGRILKRQLLIKGAEQKIDPKLISRARKHTDEITAMEINNIVKDASKRSANAYKGLTYTASNGMKVAPARNAGIAAARLFIAAPGVGKVIGATANSKVRKGINKEVQALREYYSPKRRYTEYKKNKRK